MAPQPLRLEARPQTFGSSLVCTDAVANQNVDQPPFHGGMRRTLLIRLWLDIAWEYFPSDETHQALDRCRQRRSCFVAEGFQLCWYFYQGGRRCCPQLDDMLLNLRNKK